MRANSLTDIITDPIDPPLRLVFVGHVDHGKSTLIGRLLYETGNLTDGRVKAVKEMSGRRGMPMEFAFLLDAFQAERDQGITIDTTQIPFKTKRRSYIIIDAPGHKEFLKNMVSGAASADAGILVIDAKDGIAEQSRRHGYVLSMLGIDQIAVVVNKMDLVNYERSRFNGIAAEIRSYLKNLGIDVLAIIPVSARDGVGLIQTSEKLSWHLGQNLVDVLDSFSPVEASIDRPLRLPIQNVYKFDDRRLVVGRVESGQFHVGQKLQFSPSNKQATVASIETWNAGSLPEQATVGQSVAITLDEQIFIERGHIASSPETPPIQTNVFKAHIFWLGDEPLKVGQRYTLKLTTAEYLVEIQSLDRVINTENLSPISTDFVPKNGVGEVTFRARAIVSLDSFHMNPTTGRFVLTNGQDTLGGGIVSADGYVDKRSRREVTSQNIAAVESGIALHERGLSNGHKSGILWLTGLSGAGKSTLAIALEKQLFIKGYQVYVLDGDNIRFGLSTDLGFVPEDRAENIRRVGEVAKLFADAGLLIITAFISPYCSDRDRVRAIAPDVFHEVYIKADLSICESRDPKGLYAKARRGEILDFTGISAPYEVPEHPELILDTGKNSIEQSVYILMDYVIRHFSMSQEKK